MQSNNWFIHMYAAQEQQSCVPAIDAVSVNNNPAPTS